MKKSILTLVIFVFIISILLIVNKIDNDFMKSCTKAGYSKEYCEAHK